MVGTPVLNLVVPEFNLGEVLIYNDQYYPWFTQVPQDKFGTVTKVGHDSCIADILRLVTHNVALLVATA
jgi:hypothetical protein